MRSQLSRRLADLLELPPDVVLDLPRLNIVGDAQVSLENHRGLIEYSPEILRVSTSHGEIRIRGQNLTIRSIIKEEIQVAGQIVSIDFVDWEVAR